MRPRLVLAWLLGLAAGAAVGATAQRYTDERDFLIRVDRFRIETRRAEERCDDAAVGIAESVLAYRGETIERGED